MSGSLPPGFTLDTPAPAPRAPLRQRVPTRQPGNGEVRDLGANYFATGDVVDGDTIRLNNDLVGRLFGIDAFEKGQMGYQNGKPTVNLGDLSTNALSAYIRPSQPAYGTGKQSYNRPVVTLGSGRTDPARTSLLSGTALAAPSYMGADPQRRGIYMEDERLARLNRQGAHAVEYMSPDIHRSAERWKNKLRPGEEMVWSSSVPELKPDLQRLTDDETKDYYGFLSSKMGKPDFGQADLDAYWKGKGRAATLGDDKFFEAVRKGIAPGPIDYSSWDAQTLHDFKLANGFAGLRPEVREAYGSVLGAADASPEKLKQFADINGLSFDPRDVEAFFAAKARGENPNVPIPIIDPGDGRTGATARGFGDPVGFLDEMGAAVDAIGGTDHRESIWNSSRGFRDIYENNLRQNRAIIDHDETNYPWWRFGGQMVSGAALPGSIGARGVAGYAKAGGAFGGVYGFGSADGNIGDRLLKMPVNAGLGAGLGATLGKGVDLLGPMIGKGARNMRGLGRGPSEPIAPMGAPGSLASSVRAADDLPPGFALDDVAAAPRPRDRLDIPPGPDGPLPVPALGARAPSTYPGPVPTAAGREAGPENMTRLFRGEGARDGRSRQGADEGNLWFSNDPAVAANHANKNDGEAFYLDLPTSRANELLGGQHTANVPEGEAALMRSFTNLASTRKAAINDPNLGSLSPSDAKRIVSEAAAELPPVGQRNRSWIDIEQQSAPTGGTALEQVQAMGRRLGQGRANMASDTLPSLSSPRMRDVIDVGANRTTRLMDGPTEAMMRTAAARVDPGDVLPRAANEVQSLDEFNRISQDLYPDVRAPNERDALTSRQFPSRTDPSKSFNRRGPLDLAAYVREQGGVADFRGELKAAGLSNAARKGDDFVGGENRLGRLLDDENGSTLDDMAQRAWEAGYFPDHAERPTVDEFVTALGDTYRGVNRTFRPDDYAELDAYGAARDQRFAVERAKQEGAPLADDMGLPATYDDIIANSPPAHAYDDWTNAVVSKVGNIRVDKLESPQDIGQALKIAENVAGGFDAAKRGKISFAETQQLAQDLGMTADDLLARRKGQAFSAEEAYAARAILAKSGNELVTMAKRLRAIGEDPGSEALSTFRKAMVRHAAIQEQVSGMTAEAGRALSAFRMAADSRDVPGRILEGLANSGGSSRRLKEAADAIIDLEADPTNLNRFIEKASKPKFSDRAQEIWYNYLLSGPQTHMVNVLSNTMTALGQIPEHALAAGIGATRRAIGREETDRVLFSELGARAVGLMQGTKEGLRQFGRAFRTGESADFVTKMEQQTQKAVPGIQGEILRTPTRLLTAEDELFKAMARRMELSGLAVRQAAKEGRTGQEAKERAAELLANPTDEMMVKALDYGRYLTFQRPLGDGLAGGLSRITQNQPMFKAILPFIRTPTNLIKFTAERSPLAPMVKEWRRDFAAGGARRDLAIAKVMVGSGMGATIAELAAKGIITGSPPSDENQRRLMMANGWQPYSIKIGDQYYSYRRLDPFAMTFGTAADLATMGNGMTENQREKGAALWTASVVANLASRTWLSGVTDALEALQDPERYSGNFIKRLVGAATVPTGSAQIARTMDPTMREAPDIPSYMSSRMPGQSDNLYPKRDVWGQPIVAEGGVGPDILSPIWTTTDRNDPITKEALRVGATITPPKKGELTGEQFDKLQPVIGTLARKWIGELMTSPDYQQKDREEQAKDIGHVMEAARKEAKAHVLGGEPLDDERPEKKRRTPKPPAGLPPGFEVDALPPGFVLDR